MADGPAWLGGEGTREGGVGTDKSPTDVVAGEDVAPAVIEVHDGPVLEEEGLGVSVELAVDENASFRPGVEQEEAAPRLLVEAVSVGQVGGERADGLDGLEGGIKGDAEGRLSAGVLGGGDEGEYCREE